MGINNELKVFIVIPCFNEAKNLLKTCESLGFNLKVKSCINEANLILVDNNSDDETYSIGQKLKVSYPEQVHLGSEMERGYIPPRHKGNLMAKRVAEEANIDIDRLLIIQADADTYYAPNYATAVSRASRICGLNTMIEVISRYPNSFVKQWGGYVKGCKSVDASLASAFTRSRTYDVIIDDKTCAYRLGDYFRWGMHKREFLDNGDEIYAESTRLYMKARAGATRKISIQNVFAEHSPRRILKEPLVNFITAGFPREDTWKRQWSSRERSMESFQSLLNSGSALLQEAAKLRTKHVIGLFTILPVYVNSILNHSFYQFNKRIIDRILLELPNRSLDDIVHEPGKLLTDVLHLIDHNNDFLSALTAELS